jgi:cytochrome c oxidase assembly protein Cox11
LFNTSSFVKLYTSYINYCAKDVQIFILDVSPYTFKVVCTFFNINFFVLVVCNLYINSYLSWAMHLYDDVSTFEIYKSIVHIKFFIRSSNINVVLVNALQKEILLNFYESSLFFFRVYNPTHMDVSILTIYVVYPTELTVYINKVQCFCFNNILLYPFEVLDLPVLVYIIANAYNIYFFGDFFFIFIYYIVFIV